MKDILDPAGQWLGKPPLALAAGDKRPVALDDALTVLKDSGPVTVAVLANDYDPEGGALTLISAFAALGTAVAEADNTVTYKPPPGISGSDTVTYQVADPLGQVRSAEVSVMIAEPQLSIALQPDNTLVVTAETGTIDITVTAPAEFAGTYQADVAGLAGGPINLVPPGVSGAVAAGEALAATGGLWIHDTGAGVPAQSWQWLRDGAEIAGATGAVHTLAAPDIGPGVSVRETLSDGHGQRSAESAVIGASAFTPADDPLLLGWWDADAPATITASAGSVSSWADRAGGAALVQANAALRPDTGLRSLNGRNVLDFTTAELTAARSFPASGDMAFHMALVIDGAANAFEAVLAVEAANDFQIDANNAALFDGRLNVTGIGVTVPLSGGPFSGALILSAIFDRTGSGTAEIFVSGVSRGSGAYTVPVDASAALHLMTNRSKNARADGAVAELIVTGDVSNRASHHAYLASKWGMS